MNKVFFLSILSLSTIIVFAQKTQRGYVRTVEKPGRPAQYLAGALIKTVENVNDAVSQEGGYFIIPVKTGGNKTGYTITNVLLSGYNLVDEGKLNKRQPYSPASVEILMISKKEEEQQGKRLEAKIKAELEKNYKARLLELKGQYEKIQMLNKEYEDLMRNLPELITKLVRLDYKNLTDSLDIKIAEAYEEGDFLRACQLIDLKPSMEERLLTYKSKEEASRRLAESVEKDKESIIRDCDVKISYYISKWQWDSALIYIDIKLNFDPENGELLLDKAWGIFYNIVNKGWFFTTEDEKIIYDYAMGALDILLRDHNPKLENCYELLSDICTGKEQLRYCQKRLEVLKLSEEIDSSIQKKVSYALMKIAMSYRDMGQIDSALKYYFICGYDTAICFIEIGNAYRRKHEYDKAIAFTRKALTIKPDWKPMYHNLAVMYSEVERYDSVLICLEKAGTVNNSLYYYALGQYDSALFDIEKNLTKIKNLIESYQLTYGNQTNINSGEVHYKGEYHDHLNKKAAIYSLQGDYEKSLQIYQEAETFFTVASSDRNNQAETFAGMAKAYKMLNKLEFALENYNKALLIQEELYGKKSPEAEKTRQAIKDCKKAMKKQK